MSRLGRVAGEVAGGEGHAHRERILRLQHLDLSFVELEPPDEPALLSGEGAQARFPSRVGAEPPRRERRAPFRRAAAARCGSSGRPPPRGPRARRRRSLPDGPGRRAARAIPPGVSRPMPAARARACGRRDLGAARGRGRRSARRSGGGTPAPRRSRPAGRSSRPRGCTPAPGGAGASVPSGPPPA